MAAAKTLYGIAQGPSIYPDPVPRGRKEGGSILSRGTRWASVLPFFFSRLALVAAVDGDSPEKKRSAWLLSLPTVRARACG